MTKEELDSKMALVDKEGNNRNYDLVEQYLHEVSAELEKGTLSAIEANEISANVNLNYARLYHIKRKYEKAIAYAQEALTLSEANNFLKIKAEALNVLGKLYPGDGTIALDYFNQALVVYEKLGNKSAMANVLQTIAGQQQDLGATDKAFEYYEKALVLAEASGNKSTLHMVLSHSGLSLYYIHSYDLALQYLTRALAISEEIGDKFQTAMNTANIGNVYATMEKRSEALHYYEKAYTLYQEAGPQGAIAHSTLSTNMGILYGKLKEYDKAHYYLTLSANYQQKHGEKAAFNSVLSLANLYANKEYIGYNPAKAEELFIKAEQLCDEHHASGYLYACYEARSAFYERENRMEEALTYFKKYHELEKKIQGENAVKQAQLMENRRKIEEAERDRQVKLAAFKAKETILHRVLPPQIAERIAEGEEQIADYFPTVSILFADIEGFTPMTADMPAHLVVQLLNHVFRHFDHIMKKHGCEKIKTIGDGYMAVAGAPTECADHAERMAAAAMEMIQPIDLPEEIMPFIPDGKKFSIRIGIHTGSVVAGVVGEDRFVYDIYSDAVNTAARMESHGENGRIHVSSDFMKHLSNRFSQTKNTMHGIRFESRGEMEIKGKGKMKTYFLNAEK